MSEDSKIVERMTCSSCLYWDKPTKECRFLPPQFVVLPHGGDVKQDTIKTTDNYWCGKHSYFFDTEVEDE